MEKDKKNIWIFNHYATSMYENKGGRHFWFADNLRQKGYQPAIFCSNQFHERNESIELNGEKYKIERSGKISFVFIKTYPYKGNGFSRILNMLSFYMNIFSVAKAYEGQQEIPNVILASSVHPLTLIAGIKIARKYGIPCICEMRDLWPEIIFEYSSLKKNSIMGRLLQNGEKWIYKKADKIIFTMPGGYDYIIEQNWQAAIPEEKCFHINNGVDIEEFDYNKQHYTIDDEDLKNEDTFKIVYTGAIRLANNLRVIVDVAKELRENDKIKFLVWGSGNELEELKEYVSHEKLTNIVFKGHINKVYIPYILSKADINLSHYKYINILRFGTSQNKNFEYLASGKPVLRTINAKYDIILESNSGKSVEKQTINNIKNAILDFYTIATEQKELYDEMCRNARKAAEEYDFKVLTAKLIDIIEKES